MSNIEPWNAVAAAHTVAAGDPFGHHGQTHALMAKHRLNTIGSDGTLRISDRSRARCIDLHLTHIRKIDIPQDKLDRLIIWREVAHVSSAVRAVLGWTDTLAYLDRDTGHSDLPEDLGAH